MQKQQYNRVQLHTTNSEQLYSNKGKGVHFVLLIQIKKEHS